MVRVMARRTARELTEDEIEHISGGKELKTLDSYATYVTAYQYDEAAGGLLVQYDTRRVDLSA